MDPPQQASNNCKNGNNTTKSKACTACGVRRIGGAFLLLVCRQNLDGVSVAVRRRIGVGDLDIEHRQSTSLAEYGMLH